MVVLAFGLVCLAVVGDADTARALASGNDAVSETEVYPTGDPSVDVPSVQAALDGGGPVLLKATDALTGAPTAFDFGSSEYGGGFVVIWRDVEVRGETFESHRTTIVGGFAPFRSWYPVSSSISGIDFVSTGVAALYASAATGLEFVGNRVQDVVGLPEYLPGIAKGQAVWVVGLETVTGEILIADNIVERVDAQNGYGFALFGFSADARIEHNVIRDVDTAGVLVAGHTGQVWVEDNRISPGTPDYLTPYGHGTGIIVGDALGGSAYLGNNTIECVSPWAAGILVAASRTLGEVQDHAVIEHNQVTMDDSAAAIALIGSVSNTLVADNRLEGTAEFAFQSGIWFTPEDVVESNTFRGNNISRFESTVADALFEENTRENLFLGSARSVIDLGVDNWISGTSKGKPPVPPGQQLKSHHQRAWYEEALAPTTLTE